jgi:hypothetical protein
MKRPRSTLRSFGAAREPNERIRDEICLASSLLTVGTEMLGRFSPVRTPLFAPVLAMAVSFGGAGRAHAEPSADDKALATLLFRQGRELMTQGQIPQACQKLQESQWLDAGGGTLLNLALCHEQEGRLARSWSEFKEAARVARADGRLDREVEAANHVAALEPRLSRLEILVPAAAQLEGLRIERDGRELGKGAWSTAVPIDGGEHVVRATAPGRAPFTETLVIAKESDARTVEIPLLAAPVIVVTPSPPAPEAPGSPLLTAPHLRWGGIALAGAGVIAMGAAGYVLSTALAAKVASNADCFVDGCGQEGLHQRSVAVSRGNLATLLGVGGVVLAGAGATSFYLGRRSKTDREGGISMHVVLDAAPGALATGIQGRF